MTHQRRGEEVLELRRAEPAVFLVAGEVDLVVPLDEAVPERRREGDEGEERDRDWNQPVAERTRADAPREIAHGQRLVTRASHRVGSLRDGYHGRD